MFINYQHTHKLLYRQVNSKCIKDINLRFETVNLLKETIWKNSQKMFWQLSDSKSKHNKMNMTKSIGNTSINNLSQLH